MPGVVFLIVVPSADYEREIVQGHRLENNDSPSSTVLTETRGRHTPDDNILNITSPENNAVLRLEVELRDKNAAKQRRSGRGNRSTGGRGGRAKANQKSNSDMVPSMEKILAELLVKLEIYHVTWSSDNQKNYYHVIFPMQSGEPCETALHCLTELGIGSKLNSSVSVLPCSVTYDAIASTTKREKCGFDNTEELSKWNTFVESIKSKLTVKQVVDGVRAGGSISFDYILLIVTADSLAALGLVENNAPNIVAAMLVSPLMGPVMSITFGTIISDRKLVKVGLTALALGMFISLLFGFIFGLILGTTEMPWGFSDWPTEEMRGRGNVRSLWMGVCWALTSGTGVAVALLQGATGPLIGVAISASLLPPVVNCGLFWALACTWLINPDIKMPHIKGEPYIGNSTYQFIYTNYLPTEFLINGIVSGLLTVVNVICIFITAIIVLKIKEVAAPYTASPDLRRFWETDLRTVRRTNRLTIRKKGTCKDNVQTYSSLSEPKTKELEIALERALKEAADDETFRRVQRMSYSNNAASEMTQQLPYYRSSTLTNQNHGESEAIQTSVIDADLQTLDKLISALLESRSQRKSLSRKPSIQLNRRRTLSRSLTNLIGPKSRTKPQNICGSTNTQQASMPTILEQSRLSKSLKPENNFPNSTIREVINSVVNAPHRFSIRQSLANDEESANLTNTF